MSPHDGFTPRPQTHRYSPSSLSSFAHSFDAAWKRVVERDAWPDSRAFLSAICSDDAESGSGATGNGSGPTGNGSGGATDDDPSTASSPAGTDVINFDAVGQPRRRRVGLVLTTTKKRGRINSAGGATSKGRRRRRFLDLYLFGFVDSVASTCSFSDASSHLFKTVCPLVRPSVRLPVCPSVLPPIHPSVRPSVRP